MVQRLRPQRPQGPALLQRERPREASPASSWRRPASRCASWSTNTAAACWTATSSTPTCRAAPPAASCRRSLDDIPLDFDTLQPHGCFIGSAAVIVLSQHDRARDAALNMMRFFEHESCGQCTPCRVGTGKAAQLMQAPVWDNATLEDLAQVMGDASICGLGQAAPNPDPLRPEVLSAGGLQ